MTQALVRGTGINDHPRPGAAFAVRTRGLTKRYGPQVVVDSLDLAVTVGERYGFLGPNGSGKTTTVRMLLGLVLPTRGEVEVLGRRIPRHAREVLPHVGALVEGPAAYGHLSGRTNLSLLDATGPPGAGGGRRTRAKRVEAALDQVGLAGVGRRPVKHYSLGMRQRLGLASALLRRPQLLVLDEPTNGLDPQGIREVRDLIIALNEGGTTVFLSSHLLSEVEALCTRVGVVSRGRLVVQDSVAALRAPTGRVRVRTPDAYRAAQLLGRRVVSAEDDLLVIAPAEPEEVAALLVGDGVRLTGLEAERRTLEDVVLGLAGPGNDRMAAPAPAQAAS